MSKKEKAGSGFLSAADILDADDLKSIEIDVPEWGGKVRMRELTARERERFGKMFADKNSSPENVMAVVLSMSLVDESGNNLFSEGEVTELSKKSGKVIERLVAESFKLSGIKEDSHKDAKGN